MLPRKQVIALPIIFGLLCAAPPIANADDATNHTPEIGIVFPTPSYANDAAHRQTPHTEFHPEIAEREKAFFTKHYLPKLKKFPATKKFQGKPAPVDLKSDPQAPMYRTRLREGAKAGPNFAGFYTVVTWGCGTQCASGAVIDARTGKVQFLPEPSDTGGIEYRLDSRLLVTNATTSDISPDDYTPPVVEKYFEMKNGKLVPVKP